MSSFLDVVSLKWLCKSAAVDNQEAAWSESKTWGEIKFRDEDLRVNRHVIKSWKWEEHQEQPSRGSSLKGTYFLLLVSQLPLPLEVHHHCPWCSSQSWRRTYSRRQISVPEGGPSQASVTFLRRHLVPIIPPPRPILPTQLSWVPETALEFREILSQKILLSSAIE